MPVTKPYKRATRHYTTGGFGTIDKWQYIADGRFAEEPLHYIRAFLLIQNDLQELFNYIEPADENLRTYSYRIHALYMRACIEVEANCKAILAENDYPQRNDRRGNPIRWNMEDYKKLQATHRLSGHRVTLPIWRGGIDTHAPFASWASGKKLPWYEAYHATKHDRLKSFERANFGNLIRAVCGLTALMCAQFYPWDFPTGDIGLSIGGYGGPPDGKSVAIGGYFHVKFPTWPKRMRYDFDWEAIKNDPNAFQNLTF